MPKKKKEKVLTNSNTEWNLTLKRDYVDATSFGDTDRTYLSTGPFYIQDSTGKKINSVYLNSTGSSSPYIHMEDEERFDPSAVEWEQLQKLYADDDLLRTLFDKMREWSEDDESYYWTLSYDKNGTVSIK